MMSFLLYMLAAWLFYNLVFRFIIPVYRATRKIKSSFADMQSAMRDQMNQQAMGGKRHAYASAGQSSPAGDGASQTGRGSSQTGRGSSQTGRSTSPSQRSPSPQGRDASGSPLSEEQTHAKPNDEYIDFEELK